MTSEQAPEHIGDGLWRLAVIALEFPAFRDGRAYSYARLLREKYGYEGELRAVGDVLLEQLHFMTRTGFDAFEIESDDPLRDFEIAAAEFSIWYQPTARWAQYSARASAPGILSVLSTNAPETAQRGHKSVTLGVTI